MPFANQAREGLGAVPPKQILTTSALYTTFYLAVKKRDFA